jgi:UDP-N-acetylglucosamine--N-acetylmuramyl-(pentapeptide) pyrophosphoryl-undecaprenol N-acetylglucosamine transferase
MKGLKVIIAGGGTGGHVYPGIAIAREIRDRCPENAILFVGTARGLESRVVPREGFALATISAYGLKGMRGGALARGMLAVPRGLWDSLQILQRFKPDVVLGVGGYSSGPPVLMAAISGIPAMLQEQNAQPGATNRWLSLFVRCVATSFPECERFFGRKAVLTGNPVRADFGQIPPRQEDDPLTLLVFGGSRGARAINAAVAEALSFLPAELPRLRFIHQTGERDCDQLREAYQKAGACAEVAPFFDDMPRQFAQAALVISRAGATTLAELAMAGMPAILIPFPRATDNHQQRNAESLERAGAAEMILQPALTGRLLAERIRHYLGHREQLAGMGVRSRQLSRPEAARRIVDLLEGLIHV